MTKLTRAALAAATLTLPAPPAAHAGVTPPPTDPVHVGWQGCPPGGDNPCDPIPGKQGPTVSVDPTYAARLIAWAKEPATARAAGPSLPPTDVVDLGIRN